MIFEPDEHPLDFDPDEPTEPPTFTVLRDGRLVAYVWQRPAGGSIRRAGRGQGPIASLRCADIVCYVRTAEAELLALAEQSPRLGNLRFKLSLEGYDVVRGRAQPTLHVRRF